MNVGVGRDSPTVRRRRLAAELRSLRADSGRTVAEVADYLGCKHPKVSRIENAVGGVSVGDVRLLLDFYQVDGELAEKLVGLARQSRQKGWWHGYSDVLPDWFDTYVGLESEAAASDHYEGSVVCGLLQTEEYARALTKATLWNGGEDQIERSVELRVQRQKRLFDENPITVRTVMEESAIRRPVGGVKVLGRQLHHLVKIADEPHVTVQILPTAVGAHPAMAGPFVLLRFAESSDPDVAYLETQAGALYLEDDAEVRRYEQLFEHLRAIALSPTKSVKHINSARKELE